MAERTVSAGVFTNEHDYSFLPIGIGQIGAAIIGPTVKGPAFVPTIIESQQDYDKIFGGTSEYMYTPYTIKNYLKYAGRVTVVRVLNSEGYDITVPEISVTTNTIISASYVGSGSAVITFQSSSNANFSSDLLIKLGTNTQTAVILAPTNENETSLTATSLGELSDGFILKLSSSLGLSASYSCSFSEDSNNSFKNIFGNNAWGSQLAYCYNLFDTTISNDTLLSNDLPVYMTASAFSSADSASLASQGLGIIKNGNTYFKITTGSIITSYVTESIKNCTINFSGDNASYSEASTPWITSQKIGGTDTKNLFKVVTLSHGDAANYELKITISDIKPAGTIPGSDYGQFTLTVRGIYGEFGSYDTDRKPDVKEIYTNLTLDSTQPNFIGKMIGTRYFDYTTDKDGKTKIISHGDYPNISKIIRIELSAEVERGAISPQLVPFGFNALNTPVADASNYPNATYVYDQIINGEYNSNKCWGFDYEDLNNFNYLSAIPSGSTHGNNVVFNLEDMQTYYTGSTLINVTVDSPIEMKKFVVPFQGGFDGVNPSKRKSMAENIVAGNCFGFDFTNAQSAGSKAYKAAIDTISNGEEFDINMLVMPGITHELASSVTNYAIDMINSRNDVFYIMDNATIDASVSEANNIVASIDDNYSATYYPWVKIFDSNLNKTIWVPPSVVLPGTIAYNDKVGYEWYAPAGLNRGGLTNVLETRTRLTHGERDDLYLGRINPIATFPGQGVTVWGQKTLQVKPSALDRINVRRLLIAIKKYIASATRYLVFEQNVSSTRNRFLAICNPYLESIQQRAGLYAFKVVMDETNNPPELIDQNMMKGEIYLQPTKTAEIIIIDFNIMPSGASFSA